MQDVTSKDLVDMMIDTRLEKIENYLTEFNLFDVLGIARMEIRHSNALSWLIDPHQDHNLGAGLLKGLINEAIQKRYCSKEQQYLPLCDGEVTKVLQERYETVIVRREWNNIDIFVECDNYILTIENKIDAAESDDQLSTYFSIVDKICKNKNKVGVFFFLTPEGRTAKKDEDAKKWISISYRRLIEIIEHSMENAGTNGEQKWFIESYLKVLRRQIVGEQEDNLKVLAKQFYDTHKTALKYLFEEFVSDDATTISDMIKAWLEQYKEAEENAGIGIEIGKCEKRIVRFRTKKLDGIVPKLPAERKSIWGDASTCYYEIVTNVTENGNVNIRMLLTASKTGYEDNKSEEIDKLATIVGEKNARNVTQGTKVLCSTGRTKKERITYQSLSDLNAQGDKEFHTKLEQTIKLLFQNTEDKLPVNETNE